MSGMSGLRGLSSFFESRYSLADGTRPWEPVGDDLDEGSATP
jgi:hypothetical protein